MRIYTRPKVCYSEFLIYSILSVEKEDREMVHKLMKTWCRVRIRKNKYLKDVADETANVHIIKMLDRYEVANEIACAAFACDVPRLKELMVRGTALGLSYYI